MSGQRTTIKGEWGGHEIHAGPHGWIVETTSRVQGDRTGLRVRVPYTVVPRDADLDKIVNEYGTTNAQIIVEAARTGYDPKIQTLRRGHKVQ